MLKNIIRKGFAKMAVLALVLSALLPALIPVANAGNISLKVGANLTGVTMRVYNFNQPNLFEKESDLFAANQDGFRISGNIPGALTEDYTFVFDDMANHTVSFTANGQSIQDPFLANGKWYFAIEALPNNANMLVLADYQLVNQPGDGQVDIHVHTQDENGNATDNYSYNADAFKATPDSFSKNVSDFGQGALAKDIGFQARNNYLNPGTVTITNNGISSIPTNVEVYLDVFGNPYPLNTPLTEDNTLIVVGIYTPDQQQETATINVEVIGLDGQDQANVTIFDTNFVNEPVTNNTTEAFEVNANQGHAVYCQNNIVNYTLISSDPIQVPGLAANGETTVQCEYTPANQTAKIWVAVNGLDNNDQALVDIFNAGVNDEPITEGDSQEFVVDAGQAYSVNCQDVNGFDLVEPNPNPADSGVLAANDQFNVNCEYQAEDDPVDDATITVYITGDDVDHAEVEISNGIENGQDVDWDDSQVWDVTVGEDYTVDCEEYNNYDLSISPNNGVLNNISEGNHNVYCYYDEDGSGDDTATIRVRVEGLNNNMEAEIDIPGEVNNFEIEEGDFEDFEVPGGNESYDVYCENNINGFDLESDHPIELDDVDEGDFIVVTCQYDDDNGNDDDATIRVYVDGLDNNDEARVNVYGEGTRYIEQGEYYNFNVEAGNEDHLVYCEQEVDGFELVSDYPIEVDDVDDGDFRTVTCEYDEEGDNEIIRVSVDGPSSLDEARVYIAGELNDDVENGETRNVSVEGDTDHDVYCEIVPGYNLLSPRPIEVNNINSTRNVTCEYEDANVSTGFRIEVDPETQYSYNGREVTVTVRAINATNSNANNVQLTFNYDESKLQVRNTARADVSNGDYLRWQLGTMSSGEVETRTVTFLVTGDEDETAQNFASALYDQGTVNDVDSFVHILGDEPPVIPPVYPPYIPRTGTGMLSFLLAGLASLSYVLVRKRHTILKKLKAIRQAS